MFSEIAEIALVAAQLGQFLQFLKTRVILILNFTRPHAITNTYYCVVFCLGRNLIRLQECSQDFYSQMCVEQKFPVEYECNDTRFFPAGVKRGYELELTVRGCIS